jgi:Ca-activated chloride channel family protein
MQTIVLAAILLSGCSGGSAGGAVADGKVGTVSMTVDESIAAINVLMRGMPKVVEDAEVKGTVDFDARSLYDALPDLSEREPVVKAATDVFAEIASSSEKAGQADGSNSNSWLTELVTEYNKSNPVIDGERVSIQLRSLASGDMANYALSGRRSFDAMTPSNELWLDLLDSGNIRYTELTDKLLVNTAGIMLSKAKNNELTAKYGQVDIDSVAKAVIAGELQIGVPNPLTSATGANWLYGFLMTEAPEDPLGPKGSELFRAFQENIPYIAHTTTQMSHSLEAGLLDGAVYEAQQYYTSPTLRNNYVFTPFGLPHWNPLVMFCEEGSLEAKILEDFLKTCQTDKAARRASELGFYQYPDYQAPYQVTDRTIVARMQSFWQEEKNVKPIAVVFVVDTSGSMDGEPILNAREALRQISSNIDSSTAVGLVSFSDEKKVHQKLALRPFDMDQRRFYAGTVDSLEVGGGTAMFNGILAGENMLLNYKKDHPEVQLKLFVLTDGETNGGLRESQALKVLDGTDIPMFSIGYNLDKYPKAAQVLENLSTLNEAVTINASSEDVVYRLRSLLSVEM